MIVSLPIKECKMILGNRKRKQNVGAKELKRNATREIKIDNTTPNVNYVCNSIIAYTHCQIIAI